MCGERMNRARAWLKLAALSALGLWLDQYTKGQAEARLQGRPFVTLIEGFFELRYTLNRGAFFSLGADLPDAYRVLVLGGVTVVTLGLVLSLFAQTAPEQTRLRLGLGLLLTGGAGNLIDRIHRGEVIDFLHLHMWEIFHWATFNVADVYLTVGIALLIVDLLNPQTVALPISPPP